MSLGLLAILIVPLGVALQAILGHADELVALLERLPECALAGRAEWLARVPLVGERVLATWNQLAGEGMADPGAAGPAIPASRRHVARAAGRRLRHGAACSSC